MPFNGDIRTAPVPGCVDGWLALHERFGRLPLGEVLALRRRRLPTTGSRPGVPRRHAPDARRVDRRRRARVAGRRAGRAGSVRPGVARALDAIVDARARRLLPRRVRRRAAGGRGRASTPTRTWPDRWPTGSDRSAAGCGVQDVWTMPPNSQGYLTLAAALHRRRPRPARRSRRPALGPPAGRGAPGRPATTGPTVLHERADGEALLDAHDRAARGRGSIPDAASALRSPASDGGHHLPVRGRRRPHGRVADPVERRGLRRAPVRAVDRHQPAQPRHRLLARARPSRRVRTRPAAAPHPVARAGDPRPTGGCGRCSARWAATPNPRSSCSCWPACSSPASLPGRRGWALLGGPCPHPRATAVSTPGRRPTSRSCNCEAGARPPAWADGLRRRGHRVEQAGFDPGRLRSRPPDRDGGRWVAAGGGGPIRGAIGRGGGGHRLTRRRAA